MKENDLLKIALVVSLLGLFILALVTPRLAVEERELSIINSFDDGKNVRVQGVVKSIRQGNSSTMIEISEQVSTTIVVFDSINSDKIKPGDLVAADGKVDSYNGKKQILAEKLGKIR